MSIVSLVIAPSLAQMHNSSAVATPIINKEKKVDVFIINNDSTKSEMTITERPDQGLIQALKQDGHIGEGSARIEYESGVLKVNDKIIDAEKYRSMIKGDKMKIVISEEIK